jgi:hypothetical protein
MSRSTVLKGFRFIKFTIDDVSEEGFRGPEARREIAEAKKVNTRLRTPTPGHFALHHFGQGKCSVAWCLVCI